MTGARTVDVLCACGDGKLVAMFDVDGDRVTPTGGGSYLVVTKNDRERTLQLILEWGTDDYLVSCLKCGPWVVSKDELRRARGKVKVSRRDSAGFNKLFRMDKKGNRIVIGGKRRADTDLPE
jgi:hypothetical protein